MICILEMAEWNPDNNCEEYIIAGTQAVKPNERPLIYLPPFII